MKRVVSVIIFMIVCSTMGMAQSTPSNNLKTYESISHRERINHDYFKRKVTDTTLFSITFQPEKYEKVAADISFPDGVIRDNSVVRIRIISDIYYDDLLLRAGTLIYGHGHFENERFLIKGTYLKTIDQDRYVDLDVFDIIDGRLGMVIMLPLNFFSNFSGSVKTELGIGQIAKVSAEIKKEKGSNTPYIKIDAKQTFRMFILANYSERMNSVMGN